MHHHDPCNAWWGAPGGGQLLAQQSNLVGVLPLTRSCVFVRRGVLCEYGVMLTLQGTCGYWHFATTVEQNAGEDEQCRLLLRARG